MNAILADEAAVMKGTRRAVGGLCSLTAAVGFSCFASGLLGGGYYGGYFIGWKDGYQEGGSGYDNGYRQGYRTGMLDAIEASPTAASEAVPVSETTQPIESTTPARQLKKAYRHQDLMEKRNDPDDSNGINVLDNAAGHRGTVASSVILRSGKYYWI